MRLNRQKRGLAVVLACALTLTVACERTGGSGSAREADEGGSSGNGSGAPATKADFGELTNVCQPGDAKGDTATGVKGDTIQVGTFTDFGFTQNREFLDAADAFTQWCNDAGGINGRKLTYKARDAKLFEYRQRIIEACKEDFYLVGGGAAFDGSAVKDRLKCLLPEIPAQTVSIENGGSDLQVNPIGLNRKAGTYPGFFRWLTQEAYPDSASKIGIIAGDIGATKILAGMYKETFESLNAKVVYNNVYPASGVSDWTPYAQAIKSEGVKGLAFLGDFKQLPKLQQALSDINYPLTWVDSNSNSYNKQYIELAGANLDKHPTYLDATIYPLEKASENPSTQQLFDIFKKYKPGADVTKPVVNAWSAWLLFATSARDCGAQLTRKCVYVMASAVSEWNGGGLHAPFDLQDPLAKKQCFTVEKGSSTGWSPADFKPNTDGAYRCTDETYVMKGDYGKPTTLADVQKSLADLK